MAAMRWADLYDESEREADVLGPWATYFPGKQGPTPPFLPLGQEGRNGSVSWADLFGDSDDQQHGLGAWANYSQTSPTSSSSLSTRQSLPGLLVPT